ncbi:MAG: SDR family NAD(P)-dependent oxidoreductase [Burkholderiaceae bacterium]|nr:SDR family NAD(P)-dependent oxidoreductase [Burkholderiaceae bacterium]
MNRVVIITGGSRGIGAAIARHAAAAGYPTALLYRSDRASAEAVCAECTAIGQPSMCIQADVADEPAIVAAFARVEAEMGPLGGLINNAGLNGGRVAIRDFDLMHLENLFRINVLGTMLCTREAARRMGTGSGGQGGVIVNISSMAATIGGRPGLSHYASSKSAVDAFTAGSARELAKEGIRVFAIRPGATETDLTAAGYNDPVTRAAIERTIAMGRYAKADEIAAPVVAMLSDSFAFLSGAVVDAGGGGYVFS